MLMMDTEWIREYVGWADVDPVTPVIAGSYGTWTVTYRAGKYGVDDGGTIKICVRTACDWGRFQFEDPKAPNFVTVKTNSQAALRVRLDPKAYIRPWGRGIVIDVYDGYLSPGDTVTITIGERSHGSPGSRAQTFCEKTFEFKVVVDCFGTGEFIHLPDTPTLEIISGPAAKLVAILPSTATPDETTWMMVKAEDQWGNPSAGYTGTVTFQTEDACQGLPATYHFTSADQGVHRFEGLRFTTPGIYRVQVEDTEQKLRAESNPLVYQASPLPFRPYWGDMHGQSEETVGTNSVEDYFRFAREKSGVEFCGHQGNDFQITPDVWAEIQRCVREFYEPGRFVTFLGYEWSGNTCAGGDRNVFFATDQATIFRTSHWQIADKSDIQNDRYPLPVLYEQLRGREDVLLVPHIGGRRANLEFLDPELESVLEIHSAWGTFEWFWEEALRRGYRLGIVANSDGHKGRPGASYPGASQFGVYGGLTCIYARELTREALWEALKKRRVYGTTGERILLDVRCGEHWMGEEFSVTTPPTIQVKVMGTDGIERVELKRGLETIHTVSPVPGEVKNSSLFRIAWSGARHVQRHRETVWDGSLVLDKGRIVHAEGYAFDSVAEGITSWDSKRVEWRSITTGDTDGILVQVEAPDDAQFHFTSAPKSFSLPLRNVQEEPVVFAVGGIRQRIVVQRLSGEKGPRTVEFSYTDTAMPEGWNAYYVRVLQQNGALAWSSPLYITKTP